MAAVTTNVALRADSSGTGRGTCPTAEQYSSVSTPANCCSTDRDRPPLNRPGGALAGIGVQRLEALAADLRTLPASEQSRWIDLAPVATTNGSGLYLASGSAAGDRRASAVGAPGGRYRTHEPVVALNGMSRERRAY